MDDYVPREWYYELSEDDMHEEAMDSLAEAAPQLAEALAEYVRYEQNNDLFPTGCLFLAREALNEAGLLDPYTGEILIGGKGV